MRVSIVEHVAGVWSKSSIPSGPEDALTLHCASSAAEHWMGGSLFFGELLCAARMDNREDKSSGATGPSKPGNLGFKDVMQG